MNVAAFMKIPNRAWGLVAVVLLAVAVAMILRPGVPPQAGDAAATSAAEDGERSAAPPRERPVVISPNPGGLRMSEVLTMGPEDWRERFENDFTELDPGIRDEIVMLAGELRNDIANGIPPQGEEARAYAEVILTLLAGPEVDD